MYSILRLGCIDFINTIPVCRYQNFIPYFKEIRAVPSSLNSMLKAGKLEISVVSSVEYAKSFKEYVVLSDLGLSTQGSVSSVLLLSREPMHSWHGKMVEAPFESETSVALLRILINKCWKLSCNLVPEGSQKAPIAVLRIGDRALREGYSGRWPLIWDLGQVWQNWTSLPFVYALWVVRKDFIFHQQGTHIIDVHQALIKSRNKGIANRDSCALEAFWMLGGKKSFYLDYFQRLHYKLGQMELEGLHKFYDLLLEDGLLGIKPKFYFF